MDLIRALHGHPFVGGLSEEHVARLAECARAASFAEGTFILREGAEADTFYLLTTGHVVLEVQVPGRGATQFESLHGGDVLGLHWLFPPRRWELDARATDAVTAIALDAACLRRRLDADAALGYAISMRLLEQLYARLERVRLQRLDVFRETPA